MRWTTLLLVALLLSGCTSAPARPETIDKLKPGTDRGVEAFRSNPALASYFKDAHAFAVFPALTRFGVGFGGAGGRGLVYQDEQVIGTASVGQICVGLNVGAQVYRQVIFFKDADRLEAFKDGDLEFVGQANLALGPLGGGRTPAYNQGVAVFTELRGGLMIEASVGGHRYNFRPVPE